MVKTEAQPDETQISRVAESFVDALSGKNPTIDADLIPSANRPRLPITQHFDGNIAFFRQALIEFSAIGFTNLGLVRKLESVFGQPFDEKSVLQYADKFKDEIEARRVKMRADLEKVAPPVSVLLSNVITELNDVLAERRHNQDFQTFSSVLPSYIRSIELLGRAVNEIRESQVNILQIDKSAQMSFADLRRLEQAGLIKIVDETRLMQLVPDEDST